MGSYCTAGDCEDPTRGGRRYCEFHEKRWQRAQKLGLTGLELAAYMTAPKAEKDLSSTERLFKAVEEWYDSDSEDDRDYQAKRQAVIRAAKQVAEKEPGSAISRGMAAARARGVPLGAPPKVDRARVSEVVQLHGSIRRAAAELQVSRNTVRRALRAGSTKQLSGPTLNPSAS